MKTKFLIISLLLFSSICKSQISLEHSYPASSKSNFISLVNLANSGYKYVLVDKINNTLKLYNLNHSLWKTISLNVPSGYTLGVVLNISETLFNLDALLELSYSYSKFIQTNPSYMSNESKIINENGSVLLTIQNCYYPEAFSTGTNGWKLFARTDSSTSNGCASNDIYSLPGTMPIMITDNGINNSNALSFPYPNPSQVSTTINYKLPEGSNTGEIVFYNLNGQEIKKFKVDNTYNTLELNNSDLPSGTYLYQLLSQNFMTATKKMIIIK